MTTTTDRQLYDLGQRCGRMSIDIQFVPPHAVAHVEAKLADLEHLIAHLIGNPEQD